MKRKKSSWITGDGPVEAYCEPVTTVTDTYALNNKLWASPDGNVFYSVAKTQKELPPDLYNISWDNHQLIFSRANFTTEDLIKFDDTAADLVVHDIDSFWKKRKAFDDFGLKFRRGILLYGPQGGGKTSTVKIIVKNIIDNKGIAVNFTEPGVFEAGIKNIREVQPDLSIVVVMEDIDGILRRYDNSVILNLLDGINTFDNIVYLATTNYPELLEPRIKNRPSRFDRRYKIDNPNTKSRKMYLEFLMSKSKTKDMDLNKWIKDTNSMSFSHIKELFISVNIFEYDYNTALRELKEMSKKISSEEGHMAAGFRRVDLDDIGPCEMVELD